MPGAARAAGGVGAGVGGEAEARLFALGPGAVGAADATAPWEAVGDTRCAPVGGAPFAHASAHNPHAATPARF
ncbi:MAG TPA: hypothetical protein PKA88_10170, partial [Polyangiaceae bacterium]|nr:hypothetical protein [Polyangiaceae bacterium]